MVGDSGGSGDPELPDTPGADNVELTDSSVAGSSNAPVCGTDRLPDTYMPNCMPNCLPNCMWIRCKIYSWVTSGWNGSNYLHLLRLHDVDNLDCSCSVAVIVHIN